MLPDDDVVLFGVADNRFAAAVLWLLRLHGHQQLSLMDGGRSAHPDDVLQLPPTDQVHVIRVEGTHGLPYENSDAVARLTLADAPS